MKNHRLEEASNGYDKDDKHLDNRNTSDWTNLDDLEALNRPSLTPIVSHVYRAFQAVRSILNLQLWSVLRSPIGMRARLLLLLLLFKDRWAICWSCTGARVLWSGCRHSERCRAEQDGVQEVQAAAQVPALSLTKCLGGQ